MPEWNRFQVDSPWPAELQHNFGEFSQFNCLSRVSKFLQKVVEGESHSVLHCFAYLVKEREWSISSTYNFITFDILVKESIMEGLVYIKHSLLFWWAQKRLEVFLEGLVKRKILINETKDRDTVLLDDLFN